MKSLKDRKVKEYIYTDPERYIEIVERDFEFALEKSKTSWLNKGRWSTKASICLWQKSTALINCGRIEAAKDLLEGMLGGMNIQKAEETGNSFYLLVLGNLLGALLYLESFEEARKKISSFERTISNIKTSRNVENYCKLLEWRKMELDILDGDIEKSGRYLQGVLTSENKPANPGNIYMYLGIYESKRNEKNKALEYFEKASNFIRDPYHLKKIQYYKTMLSYEEPNYNEDKDEENEVQNQIDILKGLLSNKELKINQFATVEEIEEVEAITGIKFNKQLKAFFMLFNGCNVFVQGKVMKDSVCNFRYLNLEEALNEWRKYKPYSFNQYEKWSLDSVEEPRTKPYSHHKYWFPIAKGDNINIYFDADATTKHSCGQIIGLTSYPILPFFISESLAEFLKLSNKHMLEVN